MKENAIKWKKIVVDVQNIVFYRRSIGLCEKNNSIMWRRSIGLCEKNNSIINNIIWRRSIRYYGDVQ